MNYIVLNGKKSTLITGLLVQELPPITKPGQRCIVETVDGRDGDIITPVGYAAYDKTVKIGLHGNFKIDDVIAFFDSSGTVTFSNEPDKYYTYRVVNQINFDRLVRFRTASVVLHCQPFKFSLVEDAFTSDVPFEISNTGNIEAVPTITVRGRGTVGLYLNGNQVMSVAMDADADDFVVIDAARMEAYSGTVLRNRAVTGDYDALRLHVGRNTVGWSGNVTDLTVEKYSRWI